MRKPYLLLIAAVFIAGNVFGQDTVITHITKPSDAFPIYMPQPDDYILKAKASNTDTLSDIIDAYFSVNGGEYMYAAQYGEYYIASWVPSYGFSDIVFTATSSSGAISRDTTSIEVTSNMNNVSVTSIQDLNVKFGGAGRTVYQTVSLPNHLGAFDSLHATMTVVCPPGDCDPWDRVAWVDVKGPDGTWIELIRYITPYGTSCTHEIDLTDYIFLLEGEVEFRVFVDTWAGSWEFTLDLDYFSGVPDYKYGTVTPIYDGAYPFGDYADLFPFDPVNFQFNGLTQSAKYNILLSGHGWDPAINTGNAAEFYPAVHQVFLGSDSFDQVTLRDCNPNPDGCTGQAGSWQFDRSGWCPGAITHPFEYDLSNYIGDGGVEIYYEFDNAYVDFCHPNHPDCIDFTTCDDCQAGFNPHYYIGANVFSYNNNEPFEKQLIPVGIYVPGNDQFEVSVYPNPATDLVQIRFGEIRNPMITLVDQNGRIIRKVNSSLLSNRTTYDLDVKGLSSGLYYVQVTSGRSMKVTNLVIE